MRYLEAFPDGGFFRGKNFVFDERVAHSAPNNARPAAPIGRCVLCQQPWDDYTARHRCARCRLLILLCPQCALQRRQRLEAVPSNARQSSGDAAAPTQPQCEASGVSCATEQPPMASVASANAAEGHGVVCSMCAAKDCGRKETSKQRRRRRKGTRSDSKWHSSTSCSLQGQCAALECALQPHARTAICHGRCELAECRKPRQSSAA